MYGYFLRVLPAPWADLAHATFLVLLIIGILGASIVPSAEFGYGQH
jgi:hypothetical protein